MPYRIFRTASSVFVEDTHTPGLFKHLSPEFSFNDLFTSDSPSTYLTGQLESASDAASFNPEIPYQPPIEDQEVWASGVTYFRSRTARMEEAESAGGDIFYDKVYDAERPELFFKSSASRTRGHLDKVGIRHDSTWDVPEPEFTLAISSQGEIFGCTIGNDMSSRSIEGENPLYLPQAKSYTGACAIGPCLLVGETPSLDSSIAISIHRDGNEVFSGETALNQIKRSFEELTEFLFRCNDFARGAYLMTGTGIVPDSDFTLEIDDEITITIEGIGTLTNTVEEV
ncbi:MAG: fumarylacetoacetate hydrolase family protein [Verrucomicrobiales bacterium]|nr:fumarylacetoacetate hydrolase family protein [Verrucomicrobiales bacterium]